MELRYITKLLTGYRSISHRVLVKPILDEILYPVNLKNNQINEEVIGIIYEKIKALCEERGISIAALEKDAGVGNGVIGKWRESAPNVDTLAKVAAALGVPLIKLLEG